MQRGVRVPGEGLEYLARGVRVTVRGVRVPELASDAVVHERKLAVGRTERQDLGMGEHGVSGWVSTESG